MSDMFTCAICGGTFEKTNTDEEALAEKEALFPEYTLEECAIVCEDCWKEAGYE